MPNPPDTQDILPTEPDAQSHVDAMAEHLRLHHASLIHGDGTYKLVLAGHVLFDGSRIPYRLVPGNGTLARTAKWKKWTPEMRRDEVRGRLSAEGAAELGQRVEVFVRDIAARARTAGLEPARFWKPLSESLGVDECFTRVRDRLVEAELALREELSASRTRATVNLSVYPESFPVASRMRRRMVALLGPTNSGKTHRAMDALAAAPTGVYLAPLRLLALENYERLLERGVVASLITGEERRLNPGATHVASTVEMADFQNAVDVAVVDEVQMLDDPDRGAAWVAAICGIPAATVYLLGAPGARAALEALALRLNCELHVEILQRKSPLAVQPQPVTDLRQIRRADAVICFSRREVLNWRDMLVESGHMVATLYGNLSPEVRRAQAQRFRDGEADVVVATDAIGMGLNLPIARVIFTTSEKYDGVSEDTLPVAMVHQIAGRAGRYGIHEEGVVAGMGADTHRIIRRLMAQVPPPQPTEHFLVAPGIDHLSRISTATGETRLLRLLDLFARSIDMGDRFFVPANLTEQVERAAWLDSLPLSLEDRFLLSLVPISTRIPELARTLEGWARALARGAVTRLSRTPYSQAPSPLQSAEDACKICSAYAWLGYRRPDAFPDADAAVELARHASAEVDRLLQEQNARARARRQQRGKGSRRGR